MLFKEILRRTRVDDLREICNSITVLEHNGQIDIKANLSSIWVRCKLPLT
jgi:hypothetical protein